jgi:hypothetical protein
MVSSSADTVTAMDKISEKTTAAQPIANKFNLQTMALSVTNIGPVPDLVSRIQEISDLGSALDSQLKDTKPFDNKTNQDAVAQSVVTNVRTGRALLNILISKSDLLQLAPPVGPKVAEALRRYQAVFEPLLATMVGV